MHWLATDPNNQTVADLKPHLALPSLHIVSPRRVTMASACCYPANQEQMCAVSLHALPCPSAVCRAHIGKLWNSGLQPSNRAPVCWSLCGSGGRSARSAMMSSLAGCEILEEMKSPLNPNWAPNFSAASLVYLSVLWFYLLSSVYFQQLCSIITDHWEINLCLGT